MTRDRDSDYERDSSSRSSSPDTDTVLRSSHCKHYITVKIYNYPSKKFLTERRCLLGCARTMAPMN